MATPLVTCAACDRAWHSATMADGLRLVGKCPRCSGTLLFADAAPAPAPAPAQAAAATAPHLVLGVPRR